MLHSPVKTLQKHKDLLVRTGSALRPGQCLACVDCSAFRRAQLARGHGRASAQRCLAIQRSSPGANAASARSDRIGTVTSFASQGSESSPPGRLVAATQARGRRERQLGVVAHPGRSSAWQPGSASRDGGLTWRGSTAPTGMLVTGSGSLGLPESRMCPDKQTTLAGVYDGTF